MTDLVLIHPGAQHGIYGDLGDRLTALEPPIWCRMIAGYMRDRGFTVEIIDQEALVMTPQQVALRVEEVSPRLVAIVAAGHQPSASTQQMVAAGEVARALRKVPLLAPVIILGGHPSALPERTLREEAVDYVVDGEGPRSLVALLEGRTLPEVPGLVWPEPFEDILHANVVQNLAAPLVENIDELHGDAWDLLPMDRYRAHNWHAFTGPRKPYASIYTTLGCPYRCLAGDTPVDTIYGQIPIRELVERNIIEIPIFTFDPTTKRGLVATARNIRRYGTNEKLVRVNFDDGTYIDCTPDHKFLQFKWGNGRRNSEETQWMCEAQALQPGAHVRAIRYGYAGTSNNSYPIVSWARRGRSTIHRLVAEWIAGRRLTRTDHVHHIDHNHDNWLPENLAVFSSAKEHIAQHPEIKQRMRENNPTKNGMNQEWRDNISKGVIGLKRSDESRERYRRAAIAREATMKGKVWWTRPDGTTYQSRNALSQGDVRGRKGFNAHRPINHRVVSLEPLPGLHDVYCLEVPSTGWFYANNVLVKNCSFCMINAPFHANRYRRRSPEAVVDQVQRLYSEHGVCSIKVADEMFVLNEAHYLGIAEGLARSPYAKDLNLWAYARVDTVKPETLKTLRAGGVRWLALGIESGSAHVRDGAEKRLRSDDIVGTVRAIQGAGIKIIGNYIFGLPDDDERTMRDTLELALKCRTEFANFYVAMAYPGSQLYREAIQQDWTLPATWRGYSQHNEDCRPLDTKHVDAKTVLGLRDAAFRTYFTDHGYREALLRSCGTRALEDVDFMLSYHLKRKLLEEV